jgi:hypothetical protein
VAAIFSEIADTGYTLLWKDVNLRSFNPKLAAVALAAAILIAAVDARRHMADYVLEPGRNYQRTDQTGALIFHIRRSECRLYEAMVRTGYVSLVIAMGR